MNRETWVSHTPETQPNEDALDIEEDFASVIEAELDNNSQPSPPNPFEKFFLPFETTEGNNTFAKAARRIFKSNKTATSRKILVSPSIASESIFTEDFDSAVDDFSETSDLDDISLEDPSQSNFFNDILGRQTILEGTSEEEYQNMAKKFSNKKNTVTNAAASTPAVSAPVSSTTNKLKFDIVASTPTTEDKPKFDVIENVYEGAKTVWAFGKGIIVFKPFMGVAEGAATKVLSMTAGVSSLGDADKHIKSTLAGVDQDFIDPAILKLWSVLEPIVGKGDEILKALLATLGKKAPMIEPEKKVEVASKMEKMESAEADSPETSTPAVTA